MNKITLRDTDMVDLRKVLQSGRWAAYDCETWAITPGVVMPPLVVGTTSEPDRAVQLLLKEEALDWVEALLARGDWIVGHNVVYDLAVAVRNRPRLLLPAFRAFEQNRVVDTMIIEKMRKIAHGWTKFDPRLKKRPKFGLADLVSEYLGEEMSGKKEADSWRLRYKELDGIPLEDWPPEAKIYAMDDASYTNKVFQRQMQAMSSDASMAATLVDLGRQMRAAWALHWMGAWGFRTDSAAVEDLNTRLRDHVDKAIEYLITTGIYRYMGPKKDPARKKSKHMAVLEAKVEQAYAARGEPCPLTEGGKGEVKKPKPRTNAETLINSLDPDLTLLAEISGDAKLVNTYIPILRMGTRWPINPSYNVLVDTGRTSCARPNIQNQPRKGGVRECFIPRPGHVFVGCDYQAAELRSLAQVCLSKYGHSEMAKAFEHTEKYPVGKDLHLDMAAAILGLEYDEAVARKKEPQIKEARQLSKAANFGYPGGLGAKKFIEYAWAGYGVRLSEADAKILRAQWLRKFPEVQDMFNDTGRFTAGGQRFTLKHIFSGRLRGGVGYTDGNNSNFQGLTADGAKMACWAVVKESWTGYTWDEPIPEGTTALGPSPLLGFRPSAMVHDEIMGESPRDKFREHAARLQVVMCEAMKWFLPDIPVEGEAHAMRRWFKDAESKHDENGVLQLWEPPHPAKACKELLRDDNKEVLQPLLDKSDWTIEDAHIAAQVDAQLHPDKKDRKDWTAIYTIWKLNELSKRREENADQ